MAESSLNSAPAAADRPAVLRFGPFTLDRAAVELRRGDAVVPLRPKAFDLLVALATHPGQVIMKERLIQALWPGLVVTDDSLTQCVHELRRALGDDGATLLRTVPRRGYRFDAEPVVESAPGSAPALLTTPPARRRRALWASLGAAGVAAAALGAWLIARPAPFQTPVDLARAPLPADAPPLSIVVLPLTLEGEAQESAWLADALHGDLVAQVAQLHNSHVIARDTAATYKGRVIDPRQVARELGVRHIIQVSLRQEGTRLRLNAALVDGESGVQRHAEVFETERSVLAQAVGDFAMAIERTLVGEVVRSTVERRARLSPTEITADDLAMQGLALWYRGVTRENVLAARALFDRAVVMDPDSVRAWSGVHFTTTNMLLNGWADERAVAIGRQSEAVRNLERLDRDGHYTYSARSMQLWLKGEMPAMLANNAEWAARHRLPLAYGAYGGALVFNGDFDAAVPAIERALRLGPRDPFRAEWQYRLALAHYGAGRYALARDWSRVAASTTPTLVWPPIQAAAMLRLGDRDGALRAFAEHRQRHPRHDLAQAAQRLPSPEPAFVEARERLLADLRELGMH